MFKNFKKNSLFLFSAFIFTFFLFSFCFSQKLEVNYPEIGEIKPETVKIGLPQYVKYIFNLAIMAAGLIAFAALIWAGILYLTSTGNPDKLKTARDQIFSSVVSIIILFSSYLVLSAINPELLIFKLPSLEQITLKTCQKNSDCPEGFKCENEKCVYLPELKVVKPAEIAEELPLGQSVKEDLWSKENIDDRKTFIKNFKDFLNKEESINDNGVKKYSRISNLIRYLETKTTECRCQNVHGLCSKPGTGGLFGPGAVPIGCTGDPCQTNQDNGIESDSPRAKMNEVLEIIKNKMENLSSWRENIIKKKNEIRESLRKFQEIETEIFLCKEQKQGGEIVSFSQYLKNLEFYNKIKVEPKSIKTYFAPNADPLTFFCVVGGTINDYSYFSPSFDKKLEEALDELLESAPIETEGLIQKEEQRINCPFKFPLGEVSDDLRESALIFIVKMERISDLIINMQKEIETITELVSQCNDEKCEIECKCIENPCWLHCDPLIDGPCALFCLPRCLQAIQGCHGDACPTKEINEQTKKIKEVEDKIFETIGQIEDIFPKISFLLNENDNPNNWEKITNSVEFCSSSTEEQVKGTGWQLLTCSLAKGNYSANGALIINCHPRDLYCCNPSEQEVLKAPKLPIPRDTSPTYIPITNNKFNPLPIIDNCPEGWRCSDNVKNYNQYKDASEPLKQLLSCSRQKLDLIQKKEKLKNNEILGIISNISDPKLYQGTCDWETGPKKENGCSYVYDLKKNKERVSDHYGGIICRHEKKSYAVDLDFSEDLQKKYVKEIIGAFKECSPSARVLDGVDHIHISIGQENGCMGSGD